MLSKVRRFVAFAAIICLLTSLTACSPDFSKEDPVSDQKSSGFAELMKKPDIEQATRRYAEMLEKMRLKIASAVPELPDWRKADDRSESACGFEHSDLGFDGEERSLPIISTLGPLTESDWDSAVSMVGEIAGDYGFNRTPQVLENTQGQHYVNFHNAMDGSKLSFGAIKSTIIRVHVGCHLTAEAKRRGRPSS